MSMNRLSPTIINILDILNDCCVHKGTDISQKLGLSRTAIWKSLQRLKNFGVAIQSFHNGYSLASPLILINKDIIQKNTSPYEYNLDVFETMDSTNSYLVKEGIVGKTQFCITEFQTEGRGRRGRHWYSPFGKNIYLSLSYTFLKDISELSGISLVVGIAVAKALESSDIQLSPQLKWPNDIYVNGKKLGGILIDLLGESNGACRVVIGLGLNVNMKDDEGPEIDQDWTSLEHVVHKKNDRNKLIAKLIISLMDELHLYERQGFLPFIPIWEKYDFLSTKLVALKVNNEVVQGICRGINGTGQLLLEQKKGEIKSYSAGDTCLLKKTGNS